MARFAWNWGLDQWAKQYEAWKADPSLAKPNEGALRRQLNAIKKAEFPWMLDVTKCAPQEALIALGQAFQNWFSSLSGKRKGPRLRAPRFKKKGLNDRFKIHGTQLAVDGSRIRIPKLGWVRMRDHNAAVNILAESIRAAHLDSPEESDQATAGAAEIACGEEGADAHRKMLVKPASMKQEVQA